MVAADCRAFSLIGVIAAAALGCGSPQVQEARAQAATSAMPLASATTPTPTPLPRTGLVLGDRAGWRAALKWPDSCEDAFQASRVGADAGLEFHELSAGVSLVSVLCASGSYQPSFVYVRLDDRRAAPAATVLTFPGYESADGQSLEKIEGTELWGEPTFLSKERELTVLNLSRQTGDCGIWTRYAVAGETPELKEVRARLPCPGSPGPPAIAKSGRPPRGWTIVSTLSGLTAPSALPGR